MASCVLIIESLRFRDDFAKSLRCSAWGVFFQTVVQLHNFRVEFRSENHARFFGKPEKQVYADAEIWR